MSEKAIGEFYLEELSPGDSFEVAICSCDCKTNHLRYVLTTDFKKNGTRMCVCLNTGEIRWIPDNEIVNKVDLYEIVGSDSTIQKLVKKNDEKQSKIA